MRMKWILPLILFLTLTRAVYGQTSDTQTVPIEVTVKGRDMEIIAEDPDGNRLDERTIKNGETGIFTITFEKLEDRSLILYPAHDPADRITVLIMTSLDEKGQPTYTLSADKQGQKLQNIRFTWTEHRNPKTGDAGGMWFWGMTMALCGTGLAVIGMYKGRKER